MGHVFFNTHGYIYIYGFSGNLKSFHKFWDFPDILKDPYV